VLYVDVFDADRLGQDDYLGQARFELAPYCARNGQGSSVPSKIVEPLVTPRRSPVITE
jgi:hypothetical protein